MSQVIHISVLALTLAAFAIGTSEFVIMGLLVDIAKELHVSVSKAGILVSAYAMGVVIGGPVMTLLTLKFPRKQTLIGLICLFVIGNILCALSPGYPFLLASRILTATCHGTFFGIASVVATQLVDSKHRTLAVALVFLGTTLANMLGVPIGTAEGFALGWRSTFWSIAALGSVAVIGLFLGLPNNLPPSQARAGHEFKVFQKPSVFIPLLLSALVNGGLFVVFTYITPLLMTVTHVPQHHITPILLILGAGLPIGTLLGGKLGDKALIPSLVFLFPILLVLLLGIHMFIPKEIPGVGVLFLWNMITFTIAPILQVMVVNNAAEAPNLASTFNQSAFNLGNAVGAWTGSILLAHRMNYIDLPLVSMFFIGTGWLLVLIYAKWVQQPPETALHTSTHSAVGTNRAN